MGDVLNFSQQLEELKSEIKNLKADSEYLKKKAEITPLIAIYNHVHGQNLNKEEIIVSMTITSNSDGSKYFKKNKVMAINNEIGTYTSNGWKRYFYINDVTEIKIINIINGKQKSFYYKFD